jgi:hypothetical protein
LKKRLDLKKVGDALRQAAHAGVYGQKEDRAGRVNTQTASSRESLADRERVVAKPENKVIGKRNFQK